MKTLSLALITSIIVISAAGSTYAQEESMKKASQFLELPEPVLKGEVSIEETIKKRRSVRSFSDKPLTLQEISQLLWAAQGITDERGLRASPSAGALYPLEIYLVSRRGLFRYIPEGHKLEPIVANDLRARLSQAAWNQPFVAQAPVSIAIAAVYERVTARYGERGARYVDIEVGHAAENVHLQAVALGLDSVPVGAFNDKDVSRILNLSDKEKPIYIIPVGYAK